MSTTELVANVTTFLDGLEDEFEAINATDSIEFKQEAHFALQLLTKDPNKNFLVTIARKNMQSLKNAVLNIGACGLTLNPVFKYAYLVPRKGEICLDISYLGMVQLALNSGSLQKVQARMVYGNDNFSMRSINELPIHEFNPFSKDRGEKLGCYVAAQTLEGDWLIEVMDMTEIMKIRDTSEAFKKGYGPWINYPDEMIKKTVIKRAAKLWPKTDKKHLLEKAIHIANQTEGIDFESEREREEKALAEDFPIPVEEREIGAGTYKMLYGKLRGQTLDGSEVEDLSDYAITLEKREKSKGLSPKYTEILTSICMYLEKVEGV